MIEWARQYFDVAQDGFKAEMIMLATIQGDELPGLVFETAEWQAFAHALQPDHYALPDTAPTQDTDYDRIQSLACYALAMDFALPSITIEPEDDINVIAHKVIWHSGFGRDHVSDDKAEAALVAGLDDADDDTHAKCAMALTIMGTPPDFSRCRAIIAQRLDASTYHPILCATLALIFNER